MERERHPIKRDAGDPAVPSWASVGAQPSDSTCHQFTECVLYGTILSQNRDSMLQRLRGLCDPGVKHFNEHNMCFKLRTGLDSPVQIHMRRRMNMHDSCHWQCRYVGIPEVDAKSPVIVRKTIDSTIYSTNMMEFVKTLGLRMEYEFVVQGYMFTKKHLRIAIYRVEVTESVGVYQNLKPLSDSHVIEANIMVPDGQSHEQAAKQLREFCDQFMPLCEMRKVDYMRELA